MRSSTVENGPLLATAAAKREQEQHSRRALSVGAIVIFRRQDEDKQYLSPIGVFYIFCFKLMHCRQQGSACKVTCSASPTFLHPVAFRTHCLQSFAMRVR